MSDTKYTTRHIHLAPGGDLALRTRAQRYGSRYSQRADILEFRHITAPEVVYSLFARSLRMNDVHLRPDPKHCRLNGHRHDAGRTRVSFKATRSNGVRKEGWMNEIPHNGCSCVSAKGLKRKGRLVPPRSCVLRLAKLPKESTNPRQTAAW